ncbi:FGGY-family carbohydrate kinase [Chromobacterium sp. ATCC 53434]|uniref:xylulokinase n=1 Tax=Chromobacterium sp. (strain ATCC 53434 / SC 14030) TaxID=2059672 RepID=UPI00130548A0|nr:FGGY family carbohydrate kinase [Chromobacterium sp. ATCC 53434]
MQSYIASFDIGTSEVKAALLGRHGGSSLEHSIALTTFCDGDGAVEQEARDWFDAVRRIAADWWRSGIAPSQIAMIAISGQMQNFLPLDRDQAPLHRAVLYADQRPLPEAREVNARYGADILSRELDNPLTAASILPKLLRWRSEFSRDCQRLRRIVLGAKDYVVLCLTGSHITDRTNASTTGLYLPKADAWHAGLLADYGFPLELMPELRRPGELAGVVSALAASQTGFAAGTPVLCGMGDAGAATLGAGVCRAGEAYLYLGTTAWLAHLAPPDTAAAMPCRSVFRLAGIADGLSLRVAPTLNAGNILRWALTLIGHQHGDGAADFFRQFAAEVRDVEVPASLLFVPYLHAERCPIVLPAPSGALLGITAATTRGQILQAVLQGTALSLRWCAELLGMQATAPLTVVGGGVRCEAWLQAIADTLEFELLAKPDAQMLPLRGLAALAAVELGWSRSAEAFLECIDGTMSTPTLWRPRNGDRHRIGAKFDTFKRYAAALPAMAD